MQRLLSIVSCSKTHLTAGDIQKIKHAAMDAAAAVGYRVPHPSTAPSLEFRRKGAEQLLQQSLLLGDPGEYQRWLGLLVTAMCENRELVRYLAAVILVLVTMQHSMKQHHCMGLCRISCLLCAAGQVLCLWVVLGQ